MPVPVAGGADGPVRQAAEAFAAELIRLRTAAKLSQLALAQRLGYTKSYVTHLERCTQAPTQPVARQADEFFGSGETLTRLWRAYHTARAAGRRQQSGRPTHQTPPRPAPAALHSTLPRDIAAFTGREGELHRLLRVAEEGRAPVISIHTVDGMAGVGKTALVTHAAHQLAARYPDGHRFVDLHAHTAGQPPADPADVLATLLISIGISPQNLPDTLEERAAMWRDRLAGSRMLLILDNAAGPDQVEPLLPASQECLVLVTSRRRLIALDGAEPLPLDTLPPDQAARLFTRLARRTPTDTDHSAVTEAVRLCGHLPLAITLLAGRLAHHPAWDLTTFTDEFATAQDRLGELETSDRAVAAAFDLSYQDLPPHLQHLFRHLGLHPGPDIDPYATAALTDIPLAQARRHLETLYTDHLIDEPAPRRYRLHDLLREYAHTLTTHDPADARTQATQRLLNYYTHTAQTADHHLNTTSRPHTHPTPAPGAVPDLTTREQALSWMHTEHPNLLACAHHTANHTQPTHLIALADAMAAYLRQQGPWDQAITLHRTAAERAHRTNDPLGEAGTLRDLGRVRQLTGDFTGAAELAEQALELYRALNDPLGEAHALLDLGWVQQLTGDFTAAGKTAEQALELFRALNDPLGEAHALLDLGWVQQLTGDFTAAGKTAEQALELFRALNDPLGEAHALLDLGWVQRLTGDFTAAGKTAEQALELFRALNDPLGEAGALRDLGWVRRLTGDFTAATGLARQALELYRTLGNRLGEANTLRELGWVRRLTGDFTAATGLARQALELYRTLGDRLGETYVLLDLGWVRQLTGDFTAATALLVRSRRLFEEVGDRQRETETLNSTGHPARPLRGTATGA
ncbi:ATP-binding protein [Streptomyces rapamycinicus]|uniref:ATP-binding protein n=1 Tax=Streptomyces rapamycinicus TaxID=1226757 RepID=UPI0020CA072A|nr:helix-turn-helix domain-containing protein [Streptomyces rapamycinicus]UTP34185.1 tetratricopeptide repeat protein [Streptomyces rapamycinicus NRRL 5491]